MHLKLMSGPGNVALPILKYCGVSIVASVVRRQYPVDTSLISSALWRQQSDENTLKHNEKINRIRILGENCLDQSEN